jgi:XTP/dITP diphosphohydrolase
VATSVAFVTSNPHKVEEVRRILAPFGVRVRQIERALPEPQADRLEEVVRAKLGAVPPRRGWVVVEDSGIFVPALGGFPGVYSSYALRTIGLEGMLRLLRGRPPAAYYRSVAGARRGPEVLFAMGTVHGTIAPAPRGHGGFGYDPIFIPRGEARTFAEVPGAEKDARSHRGKAFRALARKLAGS